MRRNDKPMTQNRYTCKRRNYAANTNSLSMMYVPIYRAEWWIWDRLLHEWTCQASTRNKGHDIAKNLSLIYKQNGNLPRSSYAH